MKYFVVTTAQWTAPNGDIVPSGYAINQIMADPDFVAGVGLELQIPGNQHWYKPPVSVAVPQAVELWQAKAALSAVGKLEAANQVVIALGGSIALAWQYKPTIDRSSPTVAALAERLGITSDDLDHLFIAADAINL